MTKTLDLSINITYNATLVLILLWLFWTFLSAIFLKDKYKNKDKSFGYFQLFYYLLGGIQINLVFSFFVRRFLILKDYYDVYIRDKYLDEDLFLEKTFKFIYEDYPKLITMCNYYGDKAQRKYKRKLAMSNYILKSNGSSFGQVFEACIRVFGKSEYPLYKKENDAEFDGYYFKIHTVDEPDYERKDYTMSLNTFKITTINERLDRDHIIGSIGDCLGNYILGAIELEEQIIHTVHITVLNNMSEKETHQYKLYCEDNNLPVLMEQSYIQEWRNNVGIPKRNSISLFNTESYQPNTSNLDDKNPPK